MVTKTRTHRKASPYVATTVASETHLQKQIEELRQAFQLQHEENERLKAHIEEATKPIPAPVTGWYLCPRCNGVGTHLRPSNVKRTLLLGARYKDHIPCLMCQGAKMVRIPLAQAEQSHLAPIFQCEQCHNYYAKGAGKPASEPCYQNHAKGSHCHWHDLSVPPLPEKVPEPIVPPVVGVTVASYGNMPQP